MWALLVVAHFALAALVHAGLTRLPFGPNVVARFLVAGTLAGVPLAVHLFAAYGLAAETLSGLLVYALACELYIFLFTLVSSSVSAALLLTLLHGPLNEDSIEERYSADQMVDARVGKLVANRFVVQRHDGYELTEKGRRTLATFERLRRAFRHPERPQYELPA